MSTNRVKRTIQILLEAAAYGLHRFMCYVVFEDFFGDPLVSFQAEFVLRFDLLHAANMFHELVQIRAVLTKFHDRFVRSRVEIIEMLPFTLFQAIEGVRLDALYAGLELWAYVLFCEALFRDREAQVVTVDPFEGSCTIHQSFVPALLTRICTPTTAKQGVECGDEQSEPGQLFLHEVSHLCASCSQNLRTERREILRTGGSAV